MEEAERHNTAPDDRFVCSGCVTDPYLAKILAAKREDFSCSYCDSPEAADISVLLDELDKIIRMDYVDPAEALPYESAEGGYQGTVLTGSEVIDELSEWTSNEDLLEDCFSAFAESFWCERDYFGLTQLELLRFGWEGFSNQVKHRTRYLFFQELDGYSDSIPPAQMLGTLGQLFLDFDLITELEAGRELVRARVVTAGERPSSAAELGTAPWETVIRSNRMSPSGIPMFYGAYDEETAVLETYDPESGGEHDIALARFRVARPVRLLDLTSLPPIPSSFDHRNRHLQQKIAFLHGFESNLTKPIERDDKTHLEYVPTQVVTEFVRHRLGGISGKHIDGILFQSSRARGTIVTVIFADPDQCGPRSSASVSAPDILLALSTVRYARPDEFLHLWADR